MTKSTKTFSARINVISCQKRMGFVLSAIQ
jgi:hypothetical protein